MSRGSIKLPVEGVGGEVVSRKCEPSMGLVGPVYLHPQLSLVAHQKPERRGFWRNVLQVTVGRSPISVALACRCWFSSLATVS